MGQFFTFEWDEAKALSNQRKHGVSLPIEARVFTDPAAIRIDATKPTGGEQRSKAIGLVDDRLITIVRTNRRGVCRPMSARRSNAKEERACVRPISPRSAPPSA